MVICCAVAAHYLNIARGLVGLRPGENLRRIHLRRPLSTDHQAASNLESLSGQWTVIYSTCKDSPLGWITCWSPAVGRSQHVFTQARTRQSPALFRFVVRLKVTNCVLLWGHSGRKRREPNKEFHLTETQRSPGTGRTVSSNYLPSPCTASRSSPVIF